MSTKIKDHNITRGDPFKPGILSLTALDLDGVEVDLAVASFTDLLCTVRKNKATTQTDDTDDDVVAQVSLTPGDDGVITPVGDNQVQILIHGSVTREWTQAEYFYDVQGHLTVDGEPYTPVKGRISVGWDATRTA